MGFPDNVLTAGEKVESDLHPHWQVVVPATIVGIILTAAAVYISYVTPDDTTGNTIQWIAVGVAVLLGIFLVIIPFLRWRTTRYVITTHRVMLRQGVMNKSGKDITLSKITDVSYERRMLDRMVGSGTLSIESAGDSPNELFRAIPHSDRVQQLINRLIDEDANKRAMGMVRRAQAEVASSEAPETTESVSLGKPSPMRPTGSSTESAVSREPEGAATPSSEGRPKRTGEGPQS